MRKFYFNTGVKVWVNPNIKGGIADSTGTVVIPFECDVPEDAIFMYACDDPNLHPEWPNVIVAEIKNSELYSKYAYFTIKNQNV